MSNKPVTTTLIRSTEPIAPDYEVPDSLKAWEHFDRLVRKVLEPTESRQKTFLDRPTTNTKGRAETE